MLSYSPRDPCRNKRLPPDLVPALACMIRAKFRTVVRYLSGAHRPARAAARGGQHDRVVSKGCPGVNLDRRRRRLAGAAHADEAARSVQARRLFTARERSTSRRRASSTRRAMRTPMARAASPARAAAMHAAIKPATRTDRATTRAGLCRFTAARPALPSLDQLRAADRRGCFARRRRSIPTARLVASAAIELARSLRYTGTRPLAGRWAAPGAIRPALASTSARLPKRVADQGFIDAFDF